ncbi:MAG: Hsp70 family protein [Rubrivivax sp.]|jgi:hypothetical chaperone protein|nr:Hsp70 family protein [Rubrivivax sp.]
MSSTPRTARAPRTTPASAPPRPWCAIDFGTSNSAVAVPSPAEGTPPPGQPLSGDITLVPLEQGLVTMPTAVFFRSDDAPGLEPRPDVGRAAVQAYVDGLDGRLMRSMKSILGSSLAEAHTDIGGGRSLRYLDIVSGYLRELKRRTEQTLGQSVDQAVLGRPVSFVDDDPARDAQAQRALEAAARAVGFRTLHFQLEPMAAALDHESTLQAPQCVLVADIGGGTSDFTLVRLGPQLRQKLDRRDDVLAHHGVHIAGTDFDRRLSLATLMRCLGLGAHRPARPGELPREVPSGIYFELATWHLINTVYAPARLAEVRQMRTWYAQPEHHRRLMTVLTERLGHSLAACAEQGKIDAASQGLARLDMGLVESGLALDVSEAEAAQAIESDCEAIERAAAETARRAQVSPETVDAVYLTGGSTGLAPLARRIVAQFPRARAIRGDPFASVARGLGVHAQRLFA